jgi:polyisoprenyl-teichoic acid--peptidoglycan teichoic acid transferase
MEAAVKTLSTTVLRGTAMAGLAATLAAGVAAHRSPVARALREGRPLTGIVFGTDLVDHARHSDTLMWWRYDPATPRVDIISIPRDTHVDVPGYRFRRINEVFPYHYSKTQDTRRAANALLSAVTHLLSLDSTALAPRYFLHVDYHGFRRFVDLLGGLRVHVDEPMHYDDNAGALHIHFDPGERHLSGGEALEYVRFRGKSGDRGRVIRQMDFLKALLQRIGSPALFIRWPQLLAAAVEGFDANLATGDLLFLALEAKRIRPDRVSPGLLPGRPKGPLWEMDADRTAYVLSQMEGAPRAATAAPLAGTVTVRVWNASGKSGLALAVARRLRSAGFDVLEWGDYGNRQSVTRILDRSGTIENARKIAQTLGATSVFSDVDPALRADVEVILGDDYRQ